jgi:hypothetical protein
MCLINDLFVCNVVAYELCCVMHEDDIGFGEKPSKSSR